MENHFGIRYEFDIPTIHERIDEQVNSGLPAYICAPDGNVLAMVQNDSEYKKVVNGGIFSICDSAWTPVFIKWIHGVRYQQYCGSDIFIDVIRSRKYRMLFMGASRAILDALQKNLSLQFPEMRDMIFYELPFCNVEEFDYKEIANKINKDGADIIWVALGAPKQEQFMHRLQPHLKRGVMIAVGAVFKFYSGLDEKRAPEWVRKRKLEFIYRVIQEPKKQIRRCWKIVTTIPRMLWEEWRERRVERYGIQTRGY